MFVWSCKYDVLSALREVLSSVSGKDSERSKSNREGSVR